MLMLYLVCKDTAEAKRIARHLLEQRLIAWANIHPVESLYWWKGKIQEGSEAVLIAKTGAELYDTVKLAVEKLHSYKLPCIGKLDFEANEEYAQWVAEETTKQ